jgi:hypothetical protein
MKNEEKTRFLFGISLSDRSKWQQFLICSSGFFFGYLVNGVCEVFTPSLSLSLVFRTLSGCSERKKKIAFELLVNEKRKNKLKFLHYSIFLEIFKENKFILVQFLLD